MIVLLNGSINSGKTSVAKAMCSKASGYAHIEVDSLRDFIRWMPLIESIQLNLKNAVSVAKNFHEKNLHSIITYPLSENDYLFIKDLLSDTNIELRAFTLYPGIEKLKMNRGAREITSWELNRIDELHNTGVTNPAFGITIDNSNQTIEETADQILSSLI